MSNSITPFIPFGDSSAPFTIVTRTQSGDGSVATPKGTFMAFASFTQANITHYSLYNGCGFVLMNTSSTYVIGNGGESFGTLTLTLSSSQLTLEINVKYPGTSMWSIAFFTTN